MLGPEEFQKHLPQLQTTFLDQPEPYLAAFRVENEEIIDDGQRYQIFGEGGGAELAERLEVPLVGQVPLMIPMREGSDSGRPIVAVDPDSEASVAIAKIAEVIDLELAPTRRYNPGLKLLG